MTPTTASADASAFESLLREHVAALDQGKELDDDGPHDVIFWRSVFERRFGRVRDLIIEMGSIAKEVIGPDAAVAYEITNARSDGADFNVVVKRRDCVVKRTLGLRDGSLSFSGWTGKVLTYRATDRRDRLSFFADCEEFLDALRTAVVRSLTSQ
jgi:hypothetical protein